MFMADRRTASMSQAPRVRPSASDSSIPPIPKTAPTRRFRDDTDERRRRARNRAYTDTREKRRGHEITIVLSMFHPSSHDWSTAPIHFHVNRTNDRDLWSNIRDTYRDDLQKSWRRILGFKRLKHIMPIEFSANGVPIRQDPKDMPAAHSFMHCYHHPTELKTSHEWIDWFVKFASDPDKTYGLEFQQGLWAEKLALFAIAINITIIIVSVVWAIRGGNLQTIFSVMSFVLTAVAADLALLALYFQVQAPN